MNGSVKFFQSILWAFVPAARAQAPTPMSAKSVFRIAVARVRMFVLLVMFPPQVSSFSPLLP
jgi:hypothetical protein